MDVSPKKPFRLASAKQDASCTRRGGSLCVRSQNEARGRKFHEEAIRSAFLSTNKAVGARTAPCRTATTVGLQQRACQQGGRLFSHLR